MPRDEENYVALFIDWDNLAISTAVDFAGAVPDVRAIVKAAQRSGTVLLARAYAEWNVSSDRLSVYRAGVEPVYAPTFRFEPEPGSQQPRGKSLADPCLVTDCIDTLHLMPEINVFCLVSGDKDLIPIVRLAQLRGKRVVVIGPDFVAAILRDMADEYIPYRVLAENSDSPPSNEVSLHGARGQRRVGPAQSRQTSLQSAAPPPPVAPLRPPVAPRNGPAPIAPRPATVETNGAAIVPPEIVLPAADESPVEPIPAEGGLDTAPLYEIIGGIVREREMSGKPRLRATNLKDQLLARIPGFDERKYGFLRFKDLLAGAERAGVVVRRTGPVQWVAAPNNLPTTPPPTSSPSPVPVPTPAPTAPPPVPVDVVADAPVVVTVPVAAEAAVSPVEAEDVDAEVVRFILDLRDRSRWLTYTYLLTNLLNHLGKGSNDAAADAASRTTLNRLVQTGVLVVDREPREIDVNGTHHRVRLCHIVDDHPLVARLKAQMAAEALSAEVAPTSELAGDVEPSVADSAGDGDFEPTPSEVLVATETPPDSSSSEAVESPVVQVESETAPIQETQGVTSIPASDKVGATEAQPAVAAAEVSAEPVAEPTTAAVEEAPMPVAQPGAFGLSWGFASPPLLPAPAPKPAPIAEAAPVSVAPPVEPETAPAVDVGDDQAASSDVAAATPASNAPITLADSYVILRQVIRDATGPSRPSTGPAAVKNRLVRLLGSFDERSFGFSKFKDYLQSAERAGVIHLQTVGTTARVSLPPE